MPQTSQVIRATVTPLASILGSGLLIIVPVMERTLGALSVLGVAAVCALAWVAGTSVRHCVRVVEPALDDGSLDGLDELDRFSLVVVLALTAVLAGTLLVHDLGDAFSGGLDLPPVADVGLLKTLLVLGGVVITVQGFETVRYLGDQYDTDTRVQASRLAQLVAAG